MGTLYLDRKETTIKMDGNALAFYRNGVRDGNVPLKPLDRVFIVGNIMMESAVLNKLAEQKTTVIFLSGKRLQFRGVLVNSLHQHGKLRVLQYHLSEKPFALEFSKKIVERKLNGQEKLLQEALKNKPTERMEISQGIKTLENILRQIKNKQINVNSLRGLEGGAAAAYFKAFCRIFPQSLNFNKRQKRPPKDPVNAMLSLIYTMMHWEMVREIEIIGLDPTIGFYHEFVYGRESLACDLIEPYRPDVDRFVWQVFKKRLLSSRDFTEGKERPGCYLKKGGRSKFYGLYEEWTKVTRRKWKEETENLARILKNH
ncbi:MAG: CRISPR-associated endonuclease Cas1 [Gammaproteobacteria bacterium]|nr:CRISPR-associated endonuclease Cas1 [Gammaproteobacteria bacterium]|tara:strand:- start:1240 stop:2181 length:942 start_codon:yes stop_codon:yes gene_type:complete